MLDSDLDSVGEMIPSIADAPTDAAKVVLYHAGCTDGFGSAYCFWRKLRDTVDFRPVSYAKDFPSDLPVGAWVWVVDFSYHFDQIPSHLGKVIILDHHKTAMDLNRYEHTVWDGDGKLIGTGPNMVAYIDMSRSGVGICWDYLNDSPLLPALASIQDRDLWKWELEDSDAICLGLDTLGMKFNKWHLSIDGAYDSLREKGKTIKDYRDNLIKRALSCMSWKKFTMPGRTTFTSVIVPVVNTIQFPSEIGNQLCKQYPAASFAVMWYERRDGTIQLSFRSVGNYDVGKLAQGYGGGGHKNASGAVLTKGMFKATFTEPAWWEVNEVQSTKLSCV